ncbi:MAG TPA: NAD-dependent deacylase [Acetomicrobium sp.]|mgnify:FL=1|jgi:NAD-dependent deacetylase|nr:NAD-dependent deacylase [Acetomicrobium sp.]
MDVLERITDHLRKKEVVVLTGAGMSTASGLPDFRGDQGLWKNRDPRQLASIEAMRNNPEEFYEFYRYRIRALLEVKPNMGHEILAKWERRGLLLGIITQNVDRLHQQAGSTKVYELHGNLREALCSLCGRTFDSVMLLDQIECPECNGALRPNVVLFGELLPQEALAKAHELSMSCGCFLVLGSSLEVSPANQYPVMAKRRGAKLFIVNKSPTPFDDLADGVIHDDITKTLQTIDQNLA